MISRRQGPGSARVAPRQLLGPYSPLSADTDGSTAAFFAHTSAGAAASRTWRTAPLDPHPRLGTEEMVVLGGGDSP